MHIGLIADDLTSAADGGAPFARAGHRVAVGFGPDALCNGVDMLALDLDSRRGDPGEAARRIRQAVQSLRSSALLYLTMDSTLRGHVGAQVAAALRASGRRVAIVAPAFPAGGRTTAGGRQFVDGVPVHRTRFAQDLRHPVAQSRIETLFAGLGLEPIVELAHDVIRDGSTFTAAQRDAQVIVADAATDEDLDALVANVADPGDVLWVGSPGLAQALARRHPGRHALGDRPRSVRPVVLVGSLHSASRLQASALVQARRARTVEIGRNGEIGCAGFTTRADGPALVPLLVRSQTAALDDPASVAASLGGLAHRLARRGAIDGLIATGGDTALAVARALGATGLKLWGEIEPGVAIGTLIGPYPFPTVTKAGGFGDEGALIRLWDALRGLPQPNLEGTHA